MRSSERARVSPHHAPPAIANDRAIQREDGHRTAKRACFETASFDTRTSSDHFANAFANEDGRLRAPDRQAPGFYWFQRDLRLVENQRARCAQCARGMEREK